MKKKISSDFTFLRRYSWVGFVIALLVILFFSDLKGGQKEIYIFAFAIGALLFLGMYFRLMDVEIDERFIYATYGNMTVQIPFSMIKDVRQSSPLLQKPIIVVDLKVESKVGSVIKFVPRSLWGLGLLQHPIVDQLKNLAGLNQDL